ncbi:hypothetical protein EMB92_00080 [Bifidobacterium callitrichos]|uniref:Uncharacterized protein n=1 Tax=Bifidobacterium callitrichos TaxID=762209 RepID=A0A5M9ZD50_9BIFI|nr:hypothetical protein [Bifidobacterium callitrichos]KAA8817050.1 hypothetical protein EMB92_00080 [Bifidobacterium callitrichos]
MAHDEFHLAAVRLSSFVADVIESSANIEWRNDRVAELVFSGSMDDEPSNEGCTEKSFVPSNSCSFDDVEKVMGLLTLLERIHAIGTSGLESIDFRSDTYRFTDGKTIRMAGEYVMVDLLDAHFDLLEKVCNSRTGFLTIRSEYCTLALDTEWFRGIKCGLNIMRNAAHIHHLSRRGVTGMLTGRLDVTSLIPLKQYMSGSAQFSTD